MPQNLDEFLAKTPNSQPSEDDTKKELSILPSKFDDIDKNNHIFYRPSDNDYKGIEDHPLFRFTDFKNMNGEKMRANDVFRIVHDVNGHYQSKGTFTPNGEQKAFGR